jgi:hypothetical protein
MKLKRFQIAKVYLSKNNNAESITIPDFKVCNRAIVTKTKCYGHRMRYTNQWNGRYRNKSMML